MRDGLPWFQHDATLGETAEAEAIIATYGWQGYGRYQRLRELIAGRPGCRLNLSKSLHRAQVARKLDMSPQDLDAFLAFLSDPDRCGAFHYRDCVLSDDHIDADLERARRTRKNGAERQARKRERDKAEPEGNGEDSESNALLTRDRTTHTYTHNIHNTHTDTEAAAAVHVENPVDNFEAFLWERLKSPDMKHIKVPARFIKAILNNPTEYPELCREYQELNRPPPVITAPMPNRCPSCNGRMEPKYGRDYFVSGQNRGECVECGYRMKHDKAHNRWVEEQTA